jgi:hypothetical protein
VFEACVKESVADCSDAFGLGAELHAASPLANRMAAKVTGDFVIIIFRYSNAFVGMSECGILRADVLIRSRVQRVDRLLHGLGRFPGMSRFSRDLGQFGFDFGLIRERHRELIVVATHGLLSRRELVPRRLQLDRSEFNGSVMLGVVDRGTGDRKVSDRWWR